MEPAAKVAKKEVDQLKLDPIRKLTGTIMLPGSKSLSNRALLLAALSRGSTTVENLLDSDDTRAMLGALAKLGVSIDQSARMSDNRIIIVGNAGPFDVTEGKDGNAPACELALGNAGTAMRPLAAVVCACKGKFVLDGTARMRERPIQDLVDGLRQLGSPVECTQNPPHGGCPPVRVEADGLKGGRCLISGKISSQYLSALLMTAPLAQNGPIVIEIKDELVSKDSNEAGTLSMANTGHPHTGGSQFFVNVADNRELDWFRPGDSKHPVFGRLIEGYDIAVAISKVRTHGDCPASPIRVQRIILLGA
jgi:3-phosphoshikimate 1-carboxyvinyltransferase